MQSIAVKLKNVRQHKHMVIGCVVRVMAIVTAGVSNSPFLYICCAILCNFCREVRNKAPHPHFPLLTCSHERGRHLFMSEDPDNGDLFILRTGGSQLQLSMEHPD